MVKVELMDKILIIVISWNETDKEARDITKWLNKFKDKIYWANEGYTLS